jgi:2-furoyl-CoA dehydrogenase large subunit
MLRFEGDKDFSHAPEVVWAKISDARFLVRCIPDVDSIKEQAANSASLVLRPGFAFVRGTLETTLELVDETAPTTLCWLIRSKGIGSSSLVQATLTLTPAEKGTRVHWVAEVKELGGLLKLVPGGLIRGAANKVIADAWNTADAKMTEA